MCTIAFSEADPYCIVACEGTKQKSSVVKDCQSPEWNESFIFYRRKPTEFPIKISLWNENLAIDSFIGKVRVKTLEPFEEMMLELKGRRQNKGENVPGQIKFLIENFSELDDI